MTIAHEGTRAHLQSLFTEHFGEPSGLPFVYASAPGRVELAGNHTDHQGGHTIAAAIDRRASALAIPNNTNEIHIVMEGFGKACLHLSELEARESERETSQSLVRGMVAAYVESGGTVCGFDAVTCSDIPAGSGLSSSAAFEMLLGVMLRALDESEGEAAVFDPTTLALEGVWAEHNYFGKPCGQQDQLASAHGGIQAMDFSDVFPRVSPIAFDMSSCAYALVLIDSQHDHSSHTDEYAAITADMRAVALFFGSEKLEEIPYRTFLEQLSPVRNQWGDLTVLRALHYFEETRRAQAQEQALRTGDFEKFLEGVRQSGASSAQFLQNVSPRVSGSTASQPAMVILALCMALLDKGSSLESAGRKTRGRGAYRIHGGGFDGSVLAFVPQIEVEVFMARMNELLGYEACRTVAIDPLGATAARLI